MFTRTTNTQQNAVHATTTNNANGATNGASRRAFRVSKSAQETNIIESHDILLVPVESQDLPVVVALKFIFDKAKNSHICLYRLDCPL